MGRPANCGCCCDPCETSMPESTIPAHPSHARTTTVFDDEDASHVFTIETLELGCSASVAVSPLGTERRLQIDATPSADRWLAAAAFWDDSGAAYDPHEGGSISTLVAAVCARFYNHRSAPQPDEGGLPLLAFGPCCEWEGQKFYFWHTGGILPPYDHCGTSYLATAGDAASVNGWLFRHPRPSEGWSGLGKISPCLLPDVLSRQGHRRMGRTEDWLTLIDAAAGDFDLEHRPDLSFHPTKSQPITRFGFYVGLISYRPGYHTDADYTAGTMESKSIDLVLSRPGSYFSTWGVRQLRDQVMHAPLFPSEPPQLQTIFEHPLDTLPGWHQFAFKRSDGESQPGTSFHGSFTDSPGYVALADVGLDDEYPSAVMQAPDITLPRRFGAWQDSDLLRISWTHRQHEPSAQCEPPDGRETINNWSSGISIWPFARLALRRDLASIVDAQKGGPVSPGFSTVDCGANKTALAFSHDVQHGDYVGTRRRLPAIYNDQPDYFYRQSGASSFIEVLNCGFSQQQWGLAMPSDGDRVEITIRRRFTAEYVAERHALNAAIRSNNPRYRPSIWNAYPQFMFLVAVQIHGRSNLLHQYSAGGSGSLPFFARSQWYGWIADATSIIRVALCGFAGGGWQDLKVEFSP